MTKRMRAFLLALFVTLAIMAPSILACGNDSHGYKAGATPIATIIP